MRPLATCLLAAIAAPAVASSGSVWEGDLKRAKTWKPRSGFRGQGSLASANAQLNKHLASRKELRLRDCEDYAVDELRDVLRALLPKASAELKAVYAKHDGRRAVYETAMEMEMHWADAAPAEDVRVRDAHCHEAVMWFVHHLTSEAQELAAQELVLPRLPVADHKNSSVLRSAADTGGKFYDEKVTCQACHVGGIDNLGLPEVAPESAKAKARRCYTNYMELFGIECGPCDGVAGPYKSDNDNDFEPTPCVVVAQPDEVPESERVRPKLPAQFTVDVVGGSDRFGRTTNPVHDQLPGPIAKLYGQIHGKWFMDAKPDADLWMLRHDTVYESVTENGFPIPFIAPHVSEIHAQTAKQRAENNTGPMVSLIEGMPSFLPGGCTCIPDPVGVPDITASKATGLGNMQYMGRIKLPELEYLKVPIELDHWASWFFHIYMDTNKSVVHYAKAPSRLSSAYAGMAVYDNWIMEDPKLRDPDVWHRGIPTSPEKVGPSAGKFCMNAKKMPMCDNISQSTFPPASVAAHMGNLAATATATEAQEARLPFFQSAVHLLDVLSTRPKEVVV